MKILLGMVLALLAAVAQHGAAASWRDFGGVGVGVQADRQRSGGMQRPPHGDFRRAERPPEPDKRGDGRLTAEERRDLRRDIDRANREIYKGHQR